MTKINGRLGNPSLNKALGNKSEILGCSAPVDYAIKIAKMDTDALYRHGMNEYGIRPGNRAKDRGPFEKRCVAEFRKATGQRMTQTSQRKKLTKKKQEALDAVLAKGK